MAGIRCDPVNVECAKFQWLHLVHSSDGEVESVQTDRRGVTFATDGRSQLELHDMSLVS